MFFLFNLLLTDHDHRHDAGIQAVRRVDRVHVHDPHQEIGPVHHHHGRCPEKDARFDCLATHTHIPPSRLLYFHDYYYS